MAFAEATTIAPLSMVFGCDIIVNIFSYVSVLLEESLAFMRNAEDQCKMASKGVLVRHPKDPLLPWCDSVDLFRRCEDIILSHSSTTPVIRDTSSALAHTISWRPPNERITLVELFGGIGTRLVAVGGWSHG